MISVIVPIRNEPPAAAERFARFVAPPEAELLVADGSSSGKTSEAFRRLGAQVVASAGSRGARLAAAARRARGDVLFFVHADSQPPGEALEAIRSAISGGAAAGSFSLGYEDADAGLRWVAWWANARSRWLKLPFGDQGIFCRRDVYERAGGFRDLPICDDVDLVRRLKRQGELRVLPEKSVTSPRRYRATGTLRQVFRNWRVLAGYFVGVSPERLERWYNAK